MSRALLFLTRLIHLDGVLAGDTGFVPLGLVTAPPDSIVFVREAEIKQVVVLLLRY